MLLWNTDPALLSKHKSDNNSATTHFKDRVGGIGRLRSGVVPLHQDAGCREVAAARTEEYPLAFLRIPPAVVFGLGKRKSASILMYTQVHLF
jgi:hypothetical protein